MAANDALTITQNVLKMTVAQIPNPLAAPATAIPVSVLPAPFIASNASDGNVTISPEMIYEYVVLLTLANYQYRI